MPRPRMILALFAATALAGATLAGAAVKASKPAPTGVSMVVADHVPQIDGPLTIATGACGRAVAAWAYRASGEFDVAVVVRDADATAFGAPFFFGHRNGANETDPAVAIDALGTIYLAYAITSPSRVALSVLRPGTAAWSQPVIVSGAETASAPALSLVGGRLAVAYRTERGVGLVDFPLLGNELNGIQDGPDGVDPLGAKGQVIPATANTTVFPPPAP